MNLWNRAFLYVTRKRGKSALLFAILFIIATFALISITIGNAADQAQADLRESMGGKFTVWPSMDPQNPYVVTEKHIYDKQFGLGYYNTEAVYPDVIDSIMQVDGIKYYNAQAEWNPDAEKIEFCKPPMALPLEAKLKKMANCVGVSDTEHNECFTSGAIRLMEGRNITLKDSHAAVISTDLADKNELQIGDILQLRTARLDNKPPATNGRLIELTIVGLFELQDVPEPASRQTVFEVMENRIFTDMDSYMVYGYGKECRDKNRYFQANFIIEDPAKLDEIVKQAKAISSINWVPYELYTYSDDYKQAAAPLDKLGSLMKNLLIIIVIVSACILSLILTMWVRNRVHETGVMLAMGISKAKIIGQYLVEVMLIAVLAFGLSYFSANAVMHNVKDMVTKQSATTQENNQAVVVDNSASAGVAISMSKPSDKEEANVWDTLAPVGDIGVKVTMGNLLQLIKWGGLIILLSVGISSMTVMRLKPREILSKMS